MSVSLGTNMNRLEREHLEPELTMLISLCHNWGGGGVWCVEHLGTLEWAWDEWNTWSHLREHGVCGTLGHTWADMECADWVNCALGHT